MSDARDPVERLGWRCRGCGHLCKDTARDMKLHRRAGAIACCPEREMAPVRLSDEAEIAARERAAREKALREAADLLRARATALRLKDEIERGVPAGMGVSWHADTIDGDAAAILALIDKEAAP